MFGPILSYQGSDRALNQRESAKLAFVRTIIANKCELLARFFAWPIFTILFVMAPCQVHAQLTTPIENSPFYKSPRDSPYYKSEYYKGCQSMAGSFNEVWFKNAQLHHWCYGAIAKLWFDHINEVAVEVPRGGGVLNVKELPGIGYCAYGEDDSSGKPFSKYVCETIEYDPHPNIPLWPFGPPKPWASYRPSEP
jgi:hypothetical protein